MTAYVDYSFYTGSYLGKSISEEDFPPLAMKASLYLRAVTKGLSDKATDDALDAVKMASCAIAEVLQDETRMAGSVFSADRSTSRLSSETVGSWSASYKADTVSSSEIEYLESKKRDAVRLYLAAIPLFSSLFNVQSFHCMPWRRR